MTYNLFVRQLDGRTHVLHHSSGTISGSELKARVTDKFFGSRLGVDSRLQLRLVAGTSEVTDSVTLIADHASRIFPTCTVLLRLVGGKGGFGSLLRGQGAAAQQKKTTNFDACRDMNGRRMRHVNAEKKLKDWKHEGAERQLEKTAQSYIKKLASEKKRRKEEVGDLQSLREESADVMTSMVNAVAAVVGGKKGEERVADLKGKRKMTADEEDAEEKERQTRVKKGRLMAALEEIDEDSDEEDDDEEDEEGEDEGEEGEDSEEEEGVEGVEEKGRDPNGSTEEQGMRRGDPSTDGSTEGAAGAATAAAAVAGPSMRQEDASAAAGKETATSAALNGSGHLANNLSAAVGADVRQQPGSSDMPQLAGSSSAEEGEGVGEGGRGTRSSSEDSGHPSPPNTSTPSPPAGNGSSAADSSSADDAKAVAGPPPPAAVPPGTLDLSLFPSAAALEVALGLEGLKLELQARGLKCGGTLSERAARLFLLSHTPFDEVDAKHKAKPGQGGGGKKKQ